MAEIQQRICWLHVVNSCKTRGTQRVQMIETVLRNLKYLRNLKIMIQTQDEHTSLYHADVNIS